MLGEEFNSALTAFPALTCAKPFRDHFGVEVESVRGQLDLIGPGLGLRSTGKAVHRHVGGFAELR
jgi:hypothetical protein